MQQDSRHSGESRNPWFKHVRKRVPGIKVMKFYPKNNFITLLFTLTIFTKDLDLYFYWREVPELVRNDLKRDGLNRRAWFETILLPR